MYTVHLVDNDGNTEEIAGEGRQSKAEDFAASYAEEAAPHISGVLEVRNPNGCLVSTVEFNSVEIIYSTAAY